MKAMILAAGLGTRLRPWTLLHPKALVPVEGVPMLSRVIVNLSSQGFDNLIVNAHHFADQIIEFLDDNEFSGTNICVSDERDELLDTGGGILNAVELIGNEPVLIHNVDILSTADLSGLYESHLKNKEDVTLLVSNRDSSRKLIFDKEMMLCGWHNLKTDLFRYIRETDCDVEYAFSGIYIIGRKALDALEEYSRKIGKRAFPIMDFFLDKENNLKIGGIIDENLRVLDIGKPSALESASDFLKNIQS